MATPDHALLRIRKLEKRFPGVHALAGVDLDVLSGEIHALMGQNGAGKSTLIKVLTGVYARDGGTITLCEREFSADSPADSQRKGISTVYQEVNLVPTLSVAENLLLGREPGGWLGISWRRMRYEAQQRLRQLGLSPATIDVAEPLGSYPVAIQQMVAIARALQFDAKLLIFDEPTSSLDVGETRVLFELMRVLKTRGIGIIFVTHFLDQVYEIADRVTILRNGGLVGTFPIASISRLDLVANMLGRGPTSAATPDSTVPSAASFDSPAVLRARGVSRRSAIAPFDLDLRAGEVLGLAGLLGAGRTELARLLFGADRPTTGSVEAAAHRDSAASADAFIRIRSPRSAIDAGVAFCPEERKVDGIFADMTVAENIAIVVQQRLSRFHFVSRDAHQRIAAKFIRALGIATPDADRPVRLLSGGNQQKVILARWLACEPRVLMLDEPTRGIDIGAKAEIERLIDSLAHEQRMAVLLISAELDELVRRCDRVVVLRDRRAVGELSGAALTEGAIMRQIAIKPHNAT